MSDAFQSSMDLVDCVRGQNELFVNFVSRFEAEVYISTSKSGGMKLPSHFTTLLLLKSSRVEHSYRISIFSAMTKSMARRDISTGGRGLFG